MSEEDVDRRGAMLRRLLIFSVVTLAITVLLQIVAIWKWFL